ncbi:AraC family transcriptional regulator, partial [Thioclava sp. BHET1]
MSYRPNMTAFTDGIRPLSPLRWRALDGAMVDLWHAEGQQGGGGHYLSPDPRIVIFLDDGAEAIRLTGDHDLRQKSAICYIPAGMPLRSSMTQTRTFRHLDLHFALRGLQRRLSQLAGGPVSEQLLSAPVMLESHAAILCIA